MYQAKDFMAVRWLCTTIIVLSPHPPSFKEEAEGLVCSQKWAVPNKGSWFICILDPSIVRSSWNGKKGVVERINLQCCTIWPKTIHPYQNEVLCTSEHLTCWSTPHHMSSREYIWIRRWYPQRQTNLAPCLYSA